MRRVGILFVLTSPVRGGVEEVVLSLIQRLDPSEFAPALAAPRPLLDALAPDLARVRVETLAVEAESWLRRSEVEQLGRFMRRLRPDIVNPHLFRSTAVAAPLARWNGVPTVVETYHGREGWRQGALRGTFLPDRLVCRFLDRVIAVSEAARAFLIRGKGYPAAKIVVVPNGRDLSAFRPGACRDEMRKELGLDREVPVVGVVGRLEAQKGHAYLLDAWPDVTREFPDARLLVVGEGSLREALERHARRLDITSSVMFVGFRSDIPRVLDCIDILALPSLYEGMPLTAIEASAMARPVVATSVDGTPEVIRHNVTGKLVPAGNARALAVALLGLLRDREGARQMGQAGRDYALNRFDLRTQVEATARVYRSVAGVERPLAA
jgi:glycosyltransferase involved in cell wall biosynthesis